MKTALIVLIALFAVSIIYVLYEVLNAMPYDSSWDEPMEVKDDDEF